MAVNIGPRIGIDGEAEYRKQINQIIQQTKTLKSEYDKVTSAGEKQNTTLKKNAEQHKILSQQIDSQKEKIQKLSEMVQASSEKFGESDTRTLKWKEALNQAETELNNLESKLKALPSNLELIGQKMEQMGEKAKNVGSSLTSMGHSFAPVSAAAAAGLTASAKSFMDFESGMSKVAAISGATGEDLQNLTDKAKEMGATTKFSATESAEAFSYMAMAGWKSEQMLDGIAPIMNLAAASGEELAGVSDIVTDALTAFGLKASDAAMFSDVLAAAASNSNTNVGMMGESFKYAASVAGAMGYSVQDVSIALGLMANNGIKADMAGTALRNMIQRMTKPTKESAAAMERLGVTLADDEGNMYSFRQIMDQLRGSFGHINMPMEEFNERLGYLNDALEDGTLTESKYNKEVEEIVKQAYGAEAAEKARTAAMLGGARAMPALLAIVNSTAEDYEKLTAAIDGASEPMARLADGSIVPLSQAMASGQEVIETYTGSAEQMAKIMQENVAGSWVEAKSAMEGAAIEAGEVLAPYLEKAADKVKELAQWFSNLDQETQDTIVKTAALVAAAAPLLITGGKVVSGAGSLITAGGKVTGMIGKLIPSLGSATTAMSGAASSSAAAGAGIAGLASPIGIAVAALAVLAGAFITAYNSDEQFAAEVDKSMTEAKKAMTDLINTVKPAWEAFSSALSPVFLAGMQAITRSLENTKTYFHGFSEFVNGIFTLDFKRALSGAKEIFAAEANIIISKFQFMRDSIEGIFSKMNIQIPHIKLPHFKVSGNFSINPPRTPSFSVDWYSKAMANGIRLNSPTIFGAIGNKLLGGGEAGPEWIVGENSLMGMIHNAVQGAGYANGGNTISIGDTNIIINSNGGDVDEIVERVDEIITMRLQQAEAAWA